MGKPDIQGRWAVVTGASSGLGVDFARELAARGVNTVLVARRREPMDVLAAELASRYGVQTGIVPLDLTQPGAPGDLHGRMAAAGREISILINNAGFGLYGRFVDLPLDRQLQMIDLNVRALVELTHLFAPDMVRRGFGRILQVASVAGFLPIPRFSVYAAGKAFVVSFSEGLNYELRRTGVTCTVLCPGTTRTGFFEAAGHTINIRQQVNMMESRDVGRRGILAMLSGRPLIVPGTANRLITLVTRCIPHALLLPLASESMRSSVRSQQA